MFKFDILFMLKSLLKGPADIESASVQVMAWCLFGAKSLFE